MQVVAFGPRTMVAALIWSGLNMSRIAHPMIPMELSGSCFCIAMFWVH